MNAARLAKFSAIYLEALTTAVREHPEEYSYSAEQVPRAHAAMMRAVESDTFNHDSRAIRATCKALGLKHTRKAILEWLRCP